MRLQGKVAIVTGGARGLGKDYALRFCEEGCRLVIADILDPSAVAGEIGKMGGEALAFRADVSEEESTNEIVRNAIERFGKIDILVNNAAAFADLGKKPFHEISAEDWDKVMRVNLKGTFLCCKAVYPHMKKQKKGKIINVSSGTFFSGTPYFLHYVTSKGGIVALTRALARELGDDGICVNAIAPGLTISEAVHGNPMYPEESLRSVAATRCFKRDELPEDLLGTMVFLASEDSDFITGQTIVVDGGVVLH